MDIHGDLHPIHHLSFVRKYDKQIKGTYLKADPLFDAWMAVVGKKRKQFKPELLLKFYPG